MFCDQRVFAVYDELSPQRVFVVYDELGPPRALARAFKARLIWVNWRKAKRYDLFWKNRPSRNSRRQLSASGISERELESMSEAYNKILNLTESNVGNP